MKIIFLELKFFNNKKKTEINPEFFRDFFSNFQIDKQILSGQSERLQNLSSMKESTEEYIQGEKNDVRRLSLPFTNITDGTASVRRMSVVIKKGETLDSAWKKIGFYLFLFYFYFIFILFLFIFYFLFFIFYFLLLFFIFIFIIIVIF